MFLTAEHQEKHCWKSQFPVVRRANWENNSMRIELKVILLGKSHTRKMRQLEYCLQGSLSLIPPTPQPNHQLPPMYPYLP